MMPRPRPLVAVSVLLLALAACGPAVLSPSPRASAAPPSASPQGSEPEPEPPGPLGNLVGTGWRVLRVGNLAPVAGSEPTIAFRAGEVAGTTGCNRYGGSFTIDGLRVQFGDLAQTLIGCPGAIGDMELAFIRAMRAAEDLAAQGANLVIRGTGGQILLRPDATVE